MWKDRFLYYPDRVGRSAFLRGTGALDEMIPSVSERREGHGTSIDLFRWKLVVVISIEGRFGLDK